MENMDNFDELQQLKQQMTIFKQQLSNEPIIDDEQVEKVTKRYKIRWPYAYMIWMISIFLCLLSDIWRPMIKDGDTSAIWYIVMALASLALIYLGLFWGNRGLSYFQVADGEFQHCFRFPSRKRTAIPVSKILYIEILKVPTSILGKFFWTGRTLRIRYNKYDDFYVDTPNVNDIICDLLRANQDIELKREE